MSQHKGWPSGTAYELLVLQSCIEAAERRFGVQADGLTDRVHERLALGKQRYGNLAYMRKDCIREMRFEAWDVPAYALLELQKINSTGDDLGDRGHHLGECIQHAAAIDYHARQARA